MTVVWRITEHCNLACPFCLYDRTQVRRRREADPALVRRFGAVLSDYQRETGDAVMVSWLGGEPLRWPMLEELTGHFTRDLQLRVSATTNGTTLSSPSCRTHVLSHYSELTVSVDAIGAGHDQLRHREGLFENLREDVRALARDRGEQGPQRLRLRANTVLMNRTVAEFPALCDELASWGFDEITFNQLGGDDRPEFYAENRLRAEQVTELFTALPEVRNRLASRGVRLAGSDAYLRRFMATACGKQLPVADCRPGETFLFIDETGMVAPCSFTTADCGIHLSEITDSAELRALPIRFSAQRRTRRPAACDDCRSTRVFEKFTN